MSQRTRRRRVWTVVVLTTILLALVLLPAQLVYSQVGRNALLPCAKVAFSTEEDFITQGPEPPDGNPIISDGDLLSPDGTVCARNYDLVHDAFDVNQDMGLDAADVLSVDRFLVAFSTELDSPHGNFTAGDLLFTNGVVIPNIALTVNLNVGYDIGLDAVHLVGTEETLVAWVNEIQDLGRDYWLRNPSALAGTLRQYGIDIWFSTEGTAAQPNQPGFLDGDLLSVLNGIIANNSQLLPSDVPAGIPARGVDFGLDAFSSRTRLAENALQEGFFSTSILHWPQEGLSFTDGDVLRFGNGVAATNHSLIKAFEPVVDELGLDALSLGLPPVEACRPKITELGGLKTHVSSIGADGRATLFYPTDHPFGDQVPIWGTICDDTIRFRVLYDDLSDGSSFPNGTPIAVPWSGWKLRNVDIFSPTGCTPGWPIDWGTSDPSGWYNAAMFRTYRDLGGSDDCNNDLALTNWDTASSTNPVPDGLYAVWLEWEAPAGFDHEPAPHNVRVDNTPVKIEDLVIPAGEGHCPEYTGTNTAFMVRAWFWDDHFWQYQLKIDGDCYPGSGYAYPAYHYYDLVPEAAHIDDTGTTPDGSVQDLHVVDLTMLAPSPKACAYSVQLKVWDRTIVGRFHKNGGPWDGHFRSWTDDSRYFTYTP